MAKHPWFDPQMLVGEKLEGYVIGDYVGHGGFGVVYRISDPQAEQRVIKVLYPPHSLALEDTRNWDNRASRFLQEITIASRLNHPNIVRIYDSRVSHWYYRDPNTREPESTAYSGNYPFAFYVMDYLPDGVKERLDQGKRFSTEAEPV